MTVNETDQGLFAKLRQARVVARCPACYDWQARKTATADLYRLGSTTMPSWPNEHCVRSEIAAYQPVVTR